MKKISVFGMLLAFVLLAAGCQKVNDLEGRVSALEDKTAEIEAAIEQLQAAVDGKYAVDKVEDIENGYKIVFTNGKSIELVNGKDGAPGADGKDGADGDAFFQSVTVTAEYVTIVLNDEAQTTFVLPMAVKVQIGEEGQDFILVADELAVPIVLPEFEEQVSVCATVVNSTVLTKSGASVWEAAIAKDCKSVLVKVSGAVAGDTALLQVILAKKDGTTYTSSKPVKCAKGTLSYGGYAYKTIIMADGRAWFAENLHYVPEGCTVAEADDFSVKTGVYLPCVTTADKVANASSDQDVINAQGYFYSDDVAFGGTAPTWTADTDVENNQGICPDGWHIPTLKEAVDLVGKCNNAAYTNTEAPYYNKTDSRCNLLEINQDGINFLPYSYVNDESSYGNRILNVSGVAEYAGMNSMGYIHLSTGKSATQSYALMISNLAANTTIVAGFMNVTFAANVRCIRDE
ncbi:MAG: FISUMP domain-containing protein [Candidatus Cryptobacteroides sp.]